LARGGHLRIGLEDWDDGPANVDQVEDAANLCRSVGRSVASTDAAVELLGLP